jgi:hypothetical protein
LSHVCRRSSAHHGATLEEITHHVPSVTQSRIPFCFVLFFFLARRSASAPPSAMPVRPSRHRHVPRPSRHRPPGPALVVWSLALAAWPSPCVLSPTPGACCHAYPAVPPPPPVPCLSGPQHRPLGPAPRVPQQPSPPAPRASATDIQPCGTQEEEVRGRRNMFFYFISYLCFNNYI